MARETGNARNLPFLASLPPSLPRRLHVRTTKFPRISQFFFSLPVAAAAPIPGPSSLPPPYPCSPAAPGSSPPRLTSLPSAAPAAAVVAPAVRSAVAPWWRSSSPPAVTTVRRNKRSDHAEGRANGVQCVNNADELDPWTAWAYKPRTITLLLLGACLLIWVSGALDPESTASTDCITSVKRGVWAMISVFLAYCLLQAPSTYSKDPASNSKSGIWAGMRTVRYFDGRTYEWVGISRQPSIIGKVKRTLSQFTPAQWDKDQWHPLLGPWRFIQVLSLCVVFMTVELNTFFLKFCLWIPPRNPLIIYRLILWWLIAIPTIREYNNYLQDSKPVKKVGTFCWLSLAICIVELLICIKFGQGLFPNPMPRWLISFWASVGASLLVFLFTWTWHNHTTLMKKMR
ncbi:hypothetical protein Taro_041856 [Colocasia esculenta]|uniref:CDP-diacylglycerol--serine O-phosphatidyltransferase n=1 Tax=Colocasia esculenta TaxID=4460 RepID=A0A843WMI1_COLES|nr:hypothetical protein [Colocasia esculenta]